MMARGRYLSLEEARKVGQIDQFAKEHPSEGKDAPSTHRQSETDGRNP